MALRTVGVNFEKLIPHGCTAEHFHTVFSQFAKVKLYQKKSLKFFFGPALMCLYLRLSSSPSSSNVSCVSRVPCQPRCILAPLRMLVVVVPCSVICDAYVPCVVLHVASMRQAQDAPPGRGVDPSVVSRVALWHAGANCLDARQAVVAVTARGYHISRDLMCLLTLS